MSPSGTLSTMLELPPTSNEGGISPPILSPSIPLPSHLRIFKFGAFGLTSLLPSLCIAGIAKGLGRQKVRGKGLATPCYGFPGPHLLAGVRSCFQPTCRVWKVLMDTLYYLGVPASPAPFSCSGPCFCSALSKGQDSQSVVPSQQPQHHRRTC